MDSLLEISLVYKDINEEYKIEKVYAAKFGNYYQLKAIPAFANNVAFNDVISVDSADGHLFFEDLIEQSGHSVIHIVVLNANFFNEISRKLIDCGLNINYLHSDSYLVVDVPPDVNYSMVRKYLVAQINLGNIDLSEACISDIHNY